MNRRFFGNLALIGFLLLVSVTNSHSQASQTWQVQKYDIAVDHSAASAQRVIDASATLRLRNIGASNASSVTLRLSEAAEVSGAKVGAESREIIRSQEKVGSATLQRIQLRVAAVHPGEEITVEIAYRLKVQENGALMAFSERSSQFLPLSFWYPTPNSWFFARGADFAPTTISFRGIGERTFLSSGDARSSDFNSELNIQPFFVTGEWDRLEVDGNEFFVPKGIRPDERRLAESILMFAAEAKSFMADRLGWSPREKLRLISVRRGGGFSSGGTILLDDVAIRRGRIDSQTSISVSEAIVRMYLSDGLRIFGDGHGFIREGLPRFLATEFLEKRFGPEVARAERLRQRNAYSSIANRDGALTQLSPLDDIYFNSSANKGAMIWRLLERDLGERFVLQAVSTGRKSGLLSIGGLRDERPDYGKSFTYLFDQLTTGNLLVGIPQISPGRVTVALRNTMPIQVETNVRLVVEGGLDFDQMVTIPGASFGQAVFDTSRRPLRAEIDPEGFFIQSDYSDDVAPRIFSESDVLLIIKRLFDRQEFSQVETSAGEALKRYPEMDEVRVFLARALLAQNKLAEAEKEFNTLRTGLVTSRSVSWMYLGLGEIAESRGQSTEAQMFYERAIRADGELGAVLLARRRRANLVGSPSSEESLQRFLQDFDRAAVSNRKSELDTMISPGESVRFSSGIAGQAQQWSSSIISYDRLSDGVVLVEARLSIKLLNRNQEQGTAIFRLIRVGAGWKIDGIEFFDVR